MSHTLLFLDRITRTTEAIEEAIANRDPFTPEEEAAVNGIGWNGGMAVFAFWGTFDGAKLEVQFRPNGLEVDDPGRPWYSVGESLKGATDPVPRGEIKAPGIYEVGHLGHGCEFRLNIAQVGADSVISASCAHG